MALTKDQQDHVRSAAMSLSIPAAIALGIVDKESAGRAFYTVKGAQLPAIRIEGHYVYKLLPADRRAEAVRLGLAHKKAGGLKNPGTMAARYALLDKIIAFAGAEIAYQSISIGIGQIMGANFALAGSTSAVQMFQIATSSFSSQVVQMLSFIANQPKALKAAQSFDYKALALIYNGKNAPESYWIELQDFTDRYGDGFEATTPVGENFDFGRIKALGFGTVLEFQAAAGVKVDGQIGPITRAAIATMEEARKKASTPVVTVTKAVVGGVTTVATATVAANPDWITSAVPVIEPTIKGVIQLAPLGLPFVIVGAVLVIGVVAFLAFKNRAK